MGAAGFFWIINTQEKKKNINIKLGQTTNQSNLGLFYSPRQLALVVEVLLKDKQWKNT